MEIDCVSRLRDDEYYDNVYANNVKM